MYLLDEVACSSILKDLETDPASFLATHSYSPLLLMFDIVTSTCEAFLLGIVMIWRFSAGPLSSGVQSFLQDTVGKGMPLTTHSMKKFSPMRGLGVMLVVTMCGTAMMS